MNKFSLTFEDSQLEEHYQSIQLRTIYRKVFYTFSIAAIIFMLINLIGGVADSRRHQEELKIAFLVYVFLQMMVVWRWKQYTRFALLMMNHFIMLFQLNQRENEVQHTYLFGQNQMCIHCLIMILCDFRDGAFTNITLLALRLVIAQLKEPINFQDYIYAIIIQIILMCSLYYKNLHQRRFYLLSLKEDQYDIILPTMISKPTFMFTYNEENLKFEPKKLILSGFLQNNDNPLTFYLRTAKLKEQSLENYVLERQRLNDRRRLTRHEPSKLQIIFNGNKQQVTFTEYYLEKLIFIIIIESEDKNLKANAEQFKKQQNRQNLKMIQFMKNSSKVMSRILVSRQLFLLFKLRGSFLEAMYKNYQHTTKLEFVNLSALLETMLKQLKAMNFNLDYKLKPNITIKGVKPLLMLFILDLIKHLRFSQERAVVVELTQALNLTKLFVKGQLRKQNKPLLSQYANLIKNYQASDDMHIFTFYNQPMVSFMKKERAVAFS